MMSRSPPLSQRHSDTFVTFPDFGLFCLILIAITILPLSELAHAGRSFTITRDSLSSTTASSPSTLCLWETTALFTTSLISFSTSVKARLSRGQLLLLWELMLAFTSFQLDATPLLNTLQLTTLSTSNRSIFPLEETHLFKCLHLMVLEPVAAMHSLLLIFGVESRLATPSSSTVLDSSLEESQEKAVLLTVSSGLLA